MPRILQESIEQVGWDDMRDRANAPNATPKRIHHRTPGLHLSGIIRYIGIRGKYIKGVDPVTGKWIGDEDADLCEEDMPLRMAMGMAWEEWIASLYPDMHWQPGEVFLDGVTGSPDGLSFSGADLPMLPLGTPIIEEFKCTWKSCRHGILAILIWIWQGACYAIMYGNGCRHVRFNIFWVNGDYARGGPGGPVYKRYLIEFSDTELKNIWTMILKNKNAPGVKIEA